MKKMLLNLVCLITLSAHLHADTNEEIALRDDKVAQTLQEVKELYNQRTRANSQVLDTILQKLSPIENAASDSDLNFQVFTFEAKVLYWKAKYVLTQKEDLIATATLGKNKAEEAIKADADSMYCDAYYYAAANLNLIASACKYYDLETPGGLNPPAEFTQMIDILKQACLYLLKGRLKPSINCNDLDNYDINTYYEFEGAGIERTIGVVTHRAHELNIRDWSTGPHAVYLDPKNFIEQAYNHCRKWPENIIEYCNIACYPFYLGSYSLISNARSFTWYPYYTYRVRAILDNVLSQDPKKINPDRVAETEFELSRARVLAPKVANQIKTVVDIFTHKNDFLNAYTTANKAEEEFAKRVASNQATLNALNAELIALKEIQASQEKIFATIQLLRTQIENAAPELIVKIKAYFSAQQDTLEALFTSLKEQHEQTRDPQTRDQLQFDIVIVANLSQVKRSLGDKETLVKEINLALHGTSEERAKALNYFDPLTAIILKWAFDVTPPSKENIFAELQQEMNIMQAIIRNRLNGIKNQITKTSTVLAIAQDDLEIEHRIVEELFDAYKRTINLI